MGPLQDEFRAVWRAFSAEANRFAPFAGEAGEWAGFAPCFQGGERVNSEACGLLVHHFVEVARRPLRHVAYVSEGFAEYLS